MIDLNEMMESDEYKKVKMVYPDASDDDLLLTIFSCGIVCTRNVIFKSLFESVLDKNMFESLKKGVKD